MIRLSANSPFARVPELLSLCAREVARQLRAMNHENRYTAFQNISKTLHPYIKAFPLDYIVWGCEQGIFTPYMLKYYLNHKERRWFISHCYKEDCIYGISHVKPMLRKCANYYCDNLTHNGGTMITNHWNMRYLTCDQCKSSVDWIKFKRKIHKFCKD